MIQTVKRSNEAAVYVQARYYQPTWATGCISSKDAAFLFELVMRHRPRHVAEIGVASGVSTAFLASLLSDRLEKSHLSAFDSRDRYSTAPDRVIGAAVIDVFGGVPPHVTLMPNTRGDRIVQTLRDPIPFDLVFIDANHSHPWPSLDLLSILTIMQPGTWVALHDIRLPMIHPESQSYGPLYLYQSWPGEKCQPEGDDTNIGAIRMLDSMRECVLAVLDCLDIPWQVQPEISAWASAQQMLMHTDAHGYGILQHLLQNPPLARKPPLSQYEFSSSGANCSSVISRDSLLLLTLHALPPGQPPVSLKIKGIQPSQCRGIVFPEIIQSRCAPGQAAVHISMTTGENAELARTALLLADGKPHFAYLEIPKGQSHSLEISIAVEADELALRSGSHVVEFRSVQIV